MVYQFFILSITNYGKFSSLRYPIIISHSYKSKARCSMAPAVLYCPSQGQNQILVGLEVLRMNLIPGSFGCWHYYLYCNCRTGIPLCLLLNDHWLESFIFKGHLHFMTHGWSLYSSFSDNDWLTPSDALNISDLLFYLIFILSCAVFVSLQWFWIPLLLLSAPVITFSTPE